MTTPTILKHGSAPWWVLQALRDFGPMTDKELKAMGTHETPAAIKSVQQLHMIVKNHDGVFELQPKGRNALNASNRARSRAAHNTPTPSRTNTNSSSRQIYDGAELRPNAGRPGAMDAYNVPSRVGDSRVHYRTGEVIA
jgi:hypothetical protein